MAKWAPKWTKWEEVPVENIENALQGMERITPDKIYVNNMYEVWMYRIQREDFPEVYWLSIKRRDKGVIRDWRQLQRIKTELVGAECEGFELFPAESRHVDAANQYHLYVFVNPMIRIPVGFDERLVQGAGQKYAGHLSFLNRSKQEPFDATHQPPDNVLKPELDAEGCERIV